MFGNPPAPRSAVLRSGAAPNVATPRSQIRRAGRFGCVIRGAPISLIRGAARRGAAVITTLCHRQVRKLLIPSFPSEALSRSRAAGSGRHRLPSRRPTSTPASPSARAAGSGRPPKLAGILRPGLPPSASPPPPPLPPRPPSPDPLRPNLLCLDLLRPGVPPPPAPPARAPLVETSILNGSI